MITELKGSGKNPAAPLYAALATCERVTLADYLAQASWNRRRAARSLGISYRSLLLKIQKYKLGQGEKP